MRRRLLKWWYARRFLKAYHILERQHRRHKDAGHEIHFSAASEANISLYCVNCPELQPLKRKPQDVVHATIDSRGRPIR